MINTQLGLFKYNRLPFGVSAAPSIFQRIMNSLLQDIPETVVYLDDILITGRSMREHLQNLDKTLERLSKAGLRLRLEKCAFMQKEVNYLGHRIDATRLYSDGNKVQAIKAAPEPRNVTELRSYLGSSTIMDGFYRTWQQSSNHCTSYCGKVFLGNGKRNNRQRSRRQKVIYNRTRY